MDCKSDFLKKCLSTEFCLHLFTFFFFFYHLYYYIVFKRHYAYFSQQFSGIFELLGLFMTFYKYLVGFAELTLKLFAYNVDQFRAEKNERALT